MDLVSSTDEGDIDMIFLTTAMICEAKALTRQLGLKRVKEYRQFPIYEGDGYILVVSGIGKTACAAATAFMLTRFGAGPSDLLVNIGLCASTSDRLDRGKTVIANKVIDHDSGRHFFPDMIWKHPFQEVGLETFSTCIEDGGRGITILGECVDMEASGAFEAASFFLAPHQISIIKIIYDYLSPVRPDHALVTDFLVEPCARILAWLKDLPMEVLVEQEALTEEDIGLLEWAVKRMRLTASMAWELKQLATYYRLSGWDLKDLIRPHYVPSCKTKNEGKAVFERLKRGIYPE